MMRLRDQFPDLLFVGDRIGYQPQPWRAGQRNHCPYVSGSRDSDEPMLVIDGSLTAKDLIALTDWLTRKRND